MNFLNTDPKFGEVVRFKTITKRSFSDDKKANFFLNFKSPKGRESFGLLLGTVPAREELPTEKELASRLNDLGWLSGTQLVKALGRQKAQALFDKATGRGVLKKRRRKVRRKKVVRR